MKLIYLLGDVHGSSTLNRTRRIVLHTSYHYSCTRRLVCPPLSQNVSKWPQLVGGPTRLPPYFGGAHLGREMCKNYKACVEHHVYNPHESLPTGFAIKFSGGKNMAGRIYPAQLPSPASSGCLSTFNFTRRKQNWVVWGAWCIKLWTSDTSACHFKWR